MCCIIKTTQVVFITKHNFVTKIGVHAFDTNLYLHEFFELILFFDDHGL